MNVIKRCPSKMPPDDGHVELRAIERHHQWMGLNLCNGLFQIDAGDVGSHLAAIVEADDGDVIRAPMPVVSIST